MWLPPQGSEQPEIQGYVSFIIVSAGSNMAPVTGLRNTHRISDKARDVREKMERKCGHKE